jgi:acyl carrier protein
LIETSDEHLEAGVLRRQLSTLQLEEVDPEIFWAWGETHGYDVVVSWAAQGAPACFDVLLLDHTRVDQVRRAVSPPPDAGKPWTAYANDPQENSFRQQLIPQLREYLKGRLPEYMIPSAWMALKQLPLTPNGKINRRALPAPQERPEEMGEYVAPRTELERILASIWAQVLRIEQVGVNDNFFELGGHSLNGMKLISKIAERVMVSLPVVAVFQFPTVHEMAKAVASLQSGESKPLNQGSFEFEEGVM